MLVIWTVRLLLSHIRTGTFSRTIHLNFSFSMIYSTRQYQTDQQLGQIFLWFACLAILIACLGLFGLASFTIAQRTKEVGIRKVLGRIYVGDRSAVIQGFSEAGGSGFRDCDAIGLVQYVPVAT